MEGDTLGVRIIPHVIEFKDTEISGFYKLNITVKNISKTCKDVRLYPPQSKYFKLKVKNPDRPIAPGLEVPAIIEYASQDPVEHTDRIVVTVDGTVVEVPIRAYPAQCQLALEGPVNFGNVVANSKVIAREVSIYNHGSKEGEFKLKYTGDKPIAIVPSSGKIPPHSAQIIKVEYVTKQPGKFDEVARVRLEGHDTMQLRITGNVVDGALELLSYHNEENIACVKFGSTYYGTDKTESAILFNNGPDPVCFVAILDEEATGQELGVDLTQSTSALLLAKSKPSAIESGQMNHLTSLVTAIPNQGMLGPYEKVPIFFRFSPRWRESNQGYHTTQKAPPRQDFALFMQLKVVGASEGSNVDKARKSNVEGSCLEIALTGTALPVLVNIPPYTKFDFGQCPVGEHIDHECELRNESQHMPIMFGFRRMAHFLASPTKGKVKPGQSQNITFSFVPNQVGNFKPQQFIDIIGEVADNRNPFLMHLQVIHSIPLQFLGQSDPITVKKHPVYNPGITPKITNEVGLYVDTTEKSADNNPRAALHKALTTKFHKTNMKDPENTFIAFPNDRAASIRPSERDKIFKTVFTCAERHNYVDPDYAFTDEEEKAVIAHKQYYIDYVDYLRQKRIKKKIDKDFNDYDNEKDMGMKPAAGLLPKKLDYKDAVPDPRPPTPPNLAFQLLSSKQLMLAENLSARKVKDGLNAVPSTPQEKQDCSRILTPQELHQVIIGPPTIDFGEVCLKSVSQKELNIINNLSQYVHVNVHVDCRELRQTSPLSQVIPPRSKATLPLIFESNTKGRFQRSLDYTINGFYKSHVTVFSEVVPVALELSTTELVLEPQVGNPADAGIRGVITLKNPLNYPAEFTWTPILGERGTAFSIRPATGTVEPFTDLDCEVVFHPSYLAPEDGQFALQVHGGNTLRLNCTADIGATAVQFIDRRIMFGQVSLHLTTTRTAMLKNTSLNHAYFQVMDPNPFPGLSVSPIHGVVPVGGNAELKVHLTPSAVIKFDTRVQVAIRGWKNLELRMGGTVEPPCVEIDVPNFNIGGVFCGSQLTTPFRLINRANTRTRIEFDLTRYADFTLNFPGVQAPEDITFQLMNPGVYTVTLDPEEVVPSQLIFKPTEVASYDFIMPVTINQTGAPTPSPTPFPPTPAPSNKNSVQHIINPRPMHVSIATPRRKVVATALRQPLQISHHSLDFVISPALHQIAAASGIGQSKGTLLVNNSDKPINWAVDLSRGNKVMENGVFKFLHPGGMPYLIHEDHGVEGSLDPGITHNLGVAFCPDKPGHYEVTLPIILNGDYENPYQYLTIHGELKAPQMWFDPLAIVLTPVPLRTEISSEFHIMAANYMKSSKVEVQVPQVECEDGSKISPVTVTFSDQAEIKPCCGDEGQQEPHIIAAKVTFKSDKPVSFTENIIFLDDIGNKFALACTASADNCLLTCYPFLAQHRTDHQIVCEQGASLKGRRTVSNESVNAGEAILVPCIEDPPRPSSRPSTTATSSNFEISTSSYEDSSEEPSDSTYPSTPRDGALNKLTAVDSNGEVSGANRTGIASRSLGSALFPEEDSEEGIFHTEVLLAVQRWFSSQGWPGGPNPISVPESLRNGITKKPNEEKARTSKGTSFESNNLKKEFKTIYDMVAHLCGKHIPGIPLNNPLPSDPVERAKQVYWQHNTLLTFIKTQGAAVASVKPEYLMTPGDYKNWVSIQKDLEHKRTRATGHSNTRLKTEDEEALEDQLFEAVSKRAWTDVLLQLLKTLVLSKINPRQFRNVPTPYKNQSMPQIDPDPLCSNVYSTGERIILLWLNHNYEQQRQNIWKYCSKGGVPPARWVVNFDFDLLDGLVLAAVLGAHVPFLVTSHLQDMYSQPATAEQCLHNALKVVNAMRAIGIDYDIQAIDITDPNPISLMLLCVHLYMNLPQYLPRTTIEFVGALHAVVRRQIHLNNPSNKPLTYTAMIAGRDARDFNLPKGDTITIPPKSGANIPVQFVSRFLRAAEAVVVFVGRRQGANVGSTLVFKLTTVVDNIPPKATVKCETPCYQLAKVSVGVHNPFDEQATFRIVLVEAEKDMPGGAKGAVVGAKRKKKPKKIKSKINHGQKRSDRPDSPEEEERVSPREGDNKDTVKKEEEDSGLLRAFSTQMATIDLPAHGSGIVYVNFLPFEIGRRQCSVILISDTVGEFLYSIEAVSTNPVPTEVPHVPLPRTSRISSAAAAGGGRGQFGGDERFVYWKCEVGQQLTENLPIPIRNEAKNKALVIAAQEYMSEDEIIRRNATGTLDSASLMAKAIQILAPTPAAARKFIKKGPITYQVSLSNRRFSAPDTITICDEKVQSAKAAKEGALDFVFLPIKFCTMDSGHFPCSVTLTSEEDVRVYHVECTVVPEGSEAHIEFTSPVHQPVTQDIPIINQTGNDWTLEATIDGTGFAGPHSLLAKAFQTTYYPLMFRPHFEGNVSGVLKLKNTQDDVEHVFHLTGTGERPLPLDKIVYEGQVRQKSKQTLTVPNITNKKLWYHVETDLAFLTGGDSVCVLPGQTGTYEIVFNPLKRGNFKGVLSFVSGKNPLKEIDSDGEEVCGEEVSDDQIGYRVWFAVEMNIKPAPAEAKLAISCACQKKAVLEVGVTNPTREEITLEATITGQGVEGPATITLPPQQRGVYQLVYFPAIVGKYGGSLILYNEVIGEFWYELELVATSPSPQTVPHFECELGRWVQHNITLNNPTEETLTLIPVVSNTNNFSLERENDRPLELKPNSTLQVPLTFMPSTLGRGDHTAKISFMCEQLGEWAYLASGTGLLPQPQDPVSITSKAGSNSTLIIPFRNPLDIPVLVDVILSDKCSLPPEESQPTDGDNSTFCLLLKHQVGLRLGPKSTLDIPISFAPEDMKMYESTCTVVVRKEDGSSWRYIPVDDKGIPLSRTHSGGLREIRWHYPIRGYPEVTQNADCPPAVVQCAARERVEERLEVSLSGVAPAASGPKRGIKARAVTPSDEKPRVPDGVVIGEKENEQDVIALAEEFTFEFIYGNDDVQTALEPAVALSMVRAHRDKNTGLVVLVFNIIFAPYKTMKYDVHLLVKGATGGLWRFPVRFLASEPEPDDTITIEAQGLLKESSIGFRLNSMTKDPVPYNAYFVAGSDAELWVTPGRGELLPIGTQGTLIKVNFKPSIYGKIYQGRLIVQTADMSWTYNIRGVLPDYNPPRGHSSRPMAGPHPDPRRRKGEKMNFVRENLRLTTTAVSSPIKGAPIVPRPPQRAQPEWL